MRMFVVGKSITAADICLFAVAGPHFAKMEDREKNETFPHAFRWIDHIQHLPGMLELVNMRNIFTSFPEDVAPLTKSQLKKMQKIKEAQEKKANKKKSKSKSKEKK